MDKRLLTKGGDITQYHIGNIVNQQYLDNKWKSVEVKVDDFCKDKDWAIKNELFEV
jgi:hypothetical protein